MSRAVVRRALRSGLDETGADEWAIALGRHPAEVWSHWLRDDKDAAGGAA